LSRSFHHPNDLSTGTRRITRVDEMKRLWCRPRTNLQETMNVLVATTASLLLVDGLKARVALPDMVRFSALGSIVTLLTACFLAREKLTGRRLAPELAMLSLSCGLRRTDSWKVPEKPLSMQRSLLLPVYLGENSVRSRYRIESVHAPLLALFPIRIFLGAFKASKALSFARITTIVRHVGPFFWCILCAQLPSSWIPFIRK
jgi:hypothetical protein